LIICPITPSASDYKALNKAQPGVLKQRSNKQQQVTAPPSTFTVPNFHPAPKADDDITMGESIINDRVAAVKTSVSNMEGTVSSLATSIQTLLLQLQQNQQQPSLGNAAGPKHGSRNKPYALCPTARRRIPLSPLKSREAYMILASLSPCFS
jgi:hypothetical protein